MPEGNKGVGRKRAERSRKQKIKINRYGQRSRKVEIYMYLDNSCGH